MYKLVKLQALDKKQEELRKDANAKYAEKLMNLGFISGGTFYVTVGDTYEGEFDKEPTVGEVFFLSCWKGQWFRTSPVQEVTKESEDVTLIKTMNSLYRLEKIKK